MKTKSAEHRFSWVAERFHNPFSAWFILGLSLTLTLSAALLSYQYSLATAQQRFNLKADQLSQGILDRFYNYELALQSTIAFYDVKGPLTGKEFREFVEALSVPEQLPGIQGIGFAPILQSKDIAGLESRARAEGYTDFTVRPAGEREFYAPVRYLIPEDWRNQRAFGYDMWSNPLRRIALSQSKETGKATISAKITLVQETEDDVQAGFLMYLPVYNKRDNNRHIGWVYSPYRAKDFMSGILSAKDIEYEMEVYSGESISEAQLLFDTNDNVQATNQNFEPQFKETVTLQLYGHTWTVFIHTATDGLAGTGTLVPMIVGIVGIIIDLILFLVIYSIYFLNRRSLALVDELNENKINLERANQDLEQFASIASHDLQEPLRTVGNYLDLLIEEDGDQLGEQSRKHISRTQEATQRMKSLIQGVLEYSRVGQTEISRQSIDLNLVLEAVKSDLESLFQEQEVTLEYPYLPRVLGDQSQLIRLFSNLITNAIKYRSDQDPKISIVYRTKQGHIQFDVTDNGIGIDPQHAEKVFEIFQRLHNKSIYSGTGIGLSICKRIVEIHDGEISILANPIGGTTVRFTLGNQLI